MDSVNLIQIEIVFFVPCFIYYVDDGLKRKI